ncbi:hypothetical protein SUGI_0956110 [Cryptomeria japonica]|nr:hypothetical protein SUGI_0956110 [Cryptomeria japonica]
MFRKSLIDQSRNMCQLREELIGYARELQIQYMYPVGARIATSGCKCVDLTVSSLQAANASIFCAIMTSKSEFCKLCAKKKVNDFVKKTQFFEEKIGKPAAFLFF